jgi:hypothetical protein
MIGGALLAIPSKKVHVGRHPSRLRPHRDDLLAVLPA